MPHVTFIHGISNQPPAEDLLILWRRALEQAVEPLSLADAGVTTNFIYWSDLMYAAPESNLTAYEGVLENSAEAIDGAGDARIPIGRDDAERAFLLRLRAAMTALPDELIESGAAPPLAAVPRGQLERIPLPWVLKKRFLNAFLRDVHHYLFDVTYGPPGKEAVSIQKTIRQRVLDVLKVGAGRGPHIVVAHSMGTVIAYDCLKRLGDCPAVDGLITIGSPLGMDEIQDKLQPGWTRSGGYPGGKVAAWANLYDRLDPVCALDPVLASDFERDGLPTVEDIEVSNGGVWRHSATKYLRQRAFTETLRRMLQL